jgi:palmitoyl-protein thioesterase
MNNLVADACNQIQSDDNLKNGYHALGFSQGGLFVYSRSLHKYTAISIFRRALAQRCPVPVKTLVSIGGPQRGIFGFPYCLGEQGICEYITFKFLIKE